MSVSDRDASFGRFAWTMTGVAQSWRSGLKGGSRLISVVRGMGLIDCSSQELSSLLTVALER